MPAYVCWYSQFPATVQVLKPVEAQDLDTALAAFGGRYGRDNVTAQLSEWHGRGGARRYLVQPARGKQDTPTTDNGELML